MGPVMQVKVGFVSMARCPMSHGSSALIPEEPDAPRCPRLTPNHTDRIARIVTVTMLVMLMFTFTACEEGPAPGGKVARTGHVVREGDKILIEPGASLISNGVAYTDQAPVSELSIVAVVKDGEAYLYHPDLGDVPLSRETSVEAVARFAYRRELKTASVGHDYSETSTGLNVRQRRQGYYTFENPQSRWHAVVSQEEPGAKYLAPANSLTVLEKAFREEPWFRVGDRESTDVAVNTSEVELYGSVIKGMLLDEVAMKTKAALNAGADEEYFSRLGAIELVGLLTDVINEVLEVVPIADCLRPLVAPVLEVFEGDFVSVITGEERRSSLTTVLLKTVRPLSSCIAELGGLAKTLGVLTVVNTIVDIVTTLEWLASEAASVQDIVNYDTYATMPGPFFEYTGNYGATAGRTEVNLDVRKDSFTAVTFTTPNATGALNLVSARTANAEHSDAAVWVIFDGDVTTTGNTVTMNITNVVSDGKRLTAAELERYAGCATFTAAAGDTFDDDIIRGILRCLGTEDSVRVSARIKEPVELILGTWRPLEFAVPGVGHWKLGDLTGFLHEKDRITVSQTKITWISYSAPLCPVGSECPEVVRTESVINIAGLDNTKMSTDHGGGRTFDGHYLVSGDGEFLKATFIADSNFRSDIVGSLVYYVFQRVGPAT